MNRRLHSLLLRPCRWLRSQPSPPRFRRPTPEEGHKVRNVVLGAIAGLIVLIVVAAALGGSNEDGPTDADTSGTGGIPAGGCEYSHPSPSASVISGAQYMEMLRTDRREILSAMSDVASQGAARQEHLVHVRVAFGYS